MNYSAPRVKAIPMTKLHSSYNFPWLSNFNYNSVSLQLLSLNFYSFSNWAHKKFFLPPNRSSLLVSSRYAIFCVNSLFYFFLSFFLYLLICFDFFWMIRKQREMGGTYRIFFFLGFDILFYTCEGTSRILEPGFYPPPLQIFIFYIGWPSQQAFVVVTVTVKLQVNFCNDLMLVK